MNHGISIPATETDVDALGARLAHLQAVLEASSEGMVRLDRDGRAVTWNRAAARALAPAVTLARGAVLSDAFHDKSTVEALLVRSLTGEPVTDHPLVVDGEDGRATAVHLTLVPLEDAQHRVVGATALLRDVSDDAALQEALQREQEAGEELRRLDVLKDELLSTASHELRTPLTSIAGFASLLARTVPDHAELIEPIERNAREMQQLVDGLLDQARLEAGRVTVQPIRFDLAAAVQDLIADNAEHVGDTSVLTEIPDGLMIEMDRQSFTLVLRNLLSNAVKYGADGPVTISAESLPGAVSVSVSDEGPGIPVEHQAHLFEPFFRVPGEQWSIRGSGLGLSIVRRYVELHGGEVCCSSTPGGGATFTFEVPMVQGG